MSYSKRCIVTGAAGFIGSALARLLLKETDATVLVVDKLTYAGVPESLQEVGLDPKTLTSSNPRLAFLKADICDAAAMDRAFAEFKPDTIFHLAAESHVDRSIDGPGEFIRTNVTGTATLLQAALGYWRTLGDAEKSAFRFQHISTDEVYGTLGETGFFTEKTPYSPHSPYSASKAASDHLVRAWRDTYGLHAYIEQFHGIKGERELSSQLLHNAAGLVALAAGVAQRPAAGEREGRSGRDVQRGRAQRADQSRSGEDRMLDPRRAASARGRFEIRNPHHVRRRPSWTRSPLRDRPVQTHGRTRLEATGELRLGHPQDSPVVSR